MRAQDVGAGVFFDQLLAAFVDWQRQQQLIHTQLRLDFDNCFATLITSSIPLGEQAAGADRYVRKRALQPIRKNVMILGALVRRERLGRRTNTSLVSA